MRQAGPAATHGRNRGRGRFQIPEAAPARTRAAVSRGCGGRRGRHGKPRARGGDVVETGSAATGADERQGRVSASSEGDARTDLRGADFLTTRRALPHCARRAESRSLQVAIPKRDLPASEQTATETLQRFVPRFTTHPQMSASAPPHSTEAHHASSSDGRAPSNGTTLAAPVLMATRKKQSRRSGAKSQEEGEASRARVAAGHASVRIG